MAEIAVCRRRLSSRIVTEARTARAPTQIIATGMKIAISIITKRMLSNSLEPLPTIMK